MNSRTDALLLEALQIPVGAERDAFLDEVCGGDAELRRRLNVMVADDTAAEAFFEGPATVAADVAFPSAPGEAPGDMIGRYKLLQTIGEGGFGTVWMAEQCEPVLRRVALKIIRIGMDTRQFIARFEQERQALAMMEHPNIARVLDGGATPLGRPYFVMELVRGVPITKFCDEKKLPLTARLNLFVDVCRAIQHAHQKGVIHRDIKPSNILVTVDGDKPVPKVIDFGIAKATQGRLTEKTLFTRFEHFIGTPVYMSPEQAGMGPLDIDTRSDIYALGILLYELLTGKPPFDEKSLASAGYDEMRRIIREVEPPKPSSKLSTVAGDERTTLAKARHIEPAKLSRMVEPDLDWIVMKAIDKDRSRRYETANGLARDIQRFLSNEPVSATPPSAAYKFRKFARRNKTALRIAAGVAALLVAATIVSSWLAVRAIRAEKLATDRLNEKEIALSEADDVSNLLDEAFLSPDPWRKDRNITVLETLAAAAKKLETDLASQPDRRAKLQASLGRTYHALGFYPETIALQEKVRDYYRDNFGLVHADTIKAMNNLAISYHDSGLRRGKALEMREEVMQLSSTVNGPKHSVTLSAMTNLASSLEDADRLDEALKLGEEVLLLRHEVSGPEDPETLRAMSNLANTYSNAGRPEEALKLREKVLTLRRKVLTPEHPDMLRAMHYAAMSYAAAGRQEEALKLRKEVLKLRADVLGPDHPETVGAMHFLASSLHDTGSKSAALGMREKVRKLYSDKLGLEHPLTLGAMHDLAISHLAARDLDAAIELQEKVLELRKKVESPNHPDTLAAMHSLASSYFEAGRKTEALALRQEVLEACLRSKALGPQHEKSLAAMHNLAISYDDAGRAEEALKLRNEMETQRLASFPAVRTTLVAPDSEWKWLHPIDGKNPAEQVRDFHASFFLSEFNDSAWKSGRDSDGPDGGFGYVSAPDPFNGVPIGTPDEGQRHTAYFRHRFTTDKEHPNLELRCLCDDGIIVYLDGKKVIHYNTAPGADAWKLNAVNKINDGVIDRHPISGVLAPGTHTLAISVHNCDPRSSDLRLGSVTLVEAEPPEK